MKIYFINPPAVDGVQQVREGRCMQRKGAWTAVWAPLTLALSAAVCRKEGFEVRISDCIVEEITYSGLKKKIAEWLPDLVIINAVTPALLSDLLCACVVKEVNPRIVTAVVGIHGTALPEETLKLQPTLDVIVRGEPEITIKELAKAVSAGKEWEGVEGISFRKGKAIFHNSDRPVLKDLAELTFPAWDLVNTELYRMPFSNNRFLLIATGRGCPYQCTFCADKTFYGTKLRLRSPRHIVDELAWVQRTFQVNEFLFWTESFTIDKKFSIEVADEIIKRELHVKWVCNSRVDNVDFEMLKKFRKAGCWMIGFGVETATQEILDRVKKGITIAQIRQAIEWSKAAGLEVTAHTILGLPGENRASMQQTVHFLIDLDVDFVQFYCAVPFPGSSFFEEAQEKGWITCSDWTRFEQNFSVLDYPQLTKEETMAFRNKAYRCFYLRPRACWKMLKRIHGPAELRNLLRMGKDFLDWIGQGKV